MNLGALKSRRNRVRAWRDYSRMASILGLLFLIFAQQEVLRLSAGVLTVLSAVSHLGFRLYEGHLTRVMVAEKIAVGIQIHAFEFWELDLIRTLRWKDTIRGRSFLLRAVFYLFIAVALFGTIGISFWMNYPPAYPMGALIVVGLLILGFSLLIQHVFVFTKRERQILEGSRTLKIPGELRNLPER